MLKSSWKGSVFGQGRLFPAWEREVGSMTWPRPATLFSTHIFRKLFKAFKEDLVHCQNGISNVITSPIIHTLLFSFSPSREVGEADRQQWVAGGKEPHGQ